MRISALGLPVLSLLAASVLAGCSSLSPTEDAVVLKPAPAPTGATGDTPVEGSVYGGQQALTAAKVYVFAASTTGNGGSGIAASTSNASTSLLTATTTAVSGYPISQDTLGDITNGDYGVTTDANGGFKIPNVACTTGTEIYIVSIGGYYTTTASNPVAGLMAMLGQCTGTTISSSLIASGNSRIVMNEASTIAGAYAVAGYATDAVHIGALSTSDTLAATGIKNAFANANQLESLTYGSTTARTTTPNGNGTVPTSLLNTLANILSACVNSAGATSSACGNSATYKGLFYYATSTGVAGGGTIPNDSATAAINIAHFPANNVAAIFALEGSTVVPFSPYISTTAPNDFSVGIVYTGSGLTASTVIVPHSIAVDNSGDVYMVSPGSTTSFAVFTPLGVPTTVTNTTYLATPYSVALDISGNLWMPDKASYYAVKYVPSTGAFSRIGATDWKTPKDLEFDANGNAWLTCTYYDYIIEFLVSSNTYNENYGDDVAPNSVALQSGTAGEAFTTDTGYPEVVYNNSTDSSSGDDLTTNDTYGVSVDSSNRAWSAETASYVAVGNTSGTVTEYSIKGSLANTPAPDGIVTDGSSNVWVTDTKNGTVVELNNSGTVISGSYGYVPVGNVAATSTTTSGYPVHPAAIAVDGSGDVWYATLTDSTIRELIGIATPVATPLVYGVVNGKVGQRP